MRQERNVTENRLSQKASKRNVELSNQRLINDDVQYRLESMDGEILFDNYMKIDNTNLAPETVAQMIKSSLIFDSNVEDLLPVEKHFCIQAKLSFFLLTRAKTREIHRVETLNR